MCLWLDLNPRDVLLNQNGINPYVTFGTRSLSDICKVIGYIYVRNVSYLRGNNFCLFFLQILHSNCIKTIK